VRETWARLGGEYVYAADPKLQFGASGKWKPSIHMPRAASRIRLEVASVRLERLQEITADGARAEGVPQMHGEAVRLGLIEPHGSLGDDKPCSVDLWDNATSVENFAKLWDSINGARAPWSSNPWVWVISFRRLA
jgi:hypothetical protein